MQQPQHEQIMEALLEIKGDVGEIKGEVRGINTRLDSVNGRLGTHGEDIGKLKTGQTVLKAKAAMFMSVASLIAVGIWEFVKSGFGK